MTEHNALPEGLTFPAHLLPNASLTQEEGEELLEMLWTGITRGEDQLSLYREGMEYSLDEEEMTTAEVRAVVEHLLEARRSQQAAFGDLGASKLQRAFDALREARIVAEMDFTCCGTCGAAEIGEKEYEAGELDQWLGYVFFHSQDTESLLEDGHVYLNYGIFWPAHLSEAEFSALSEKERDQLYESDTIQLMNEVVIPILERHDITVVWNRDMGTRIRLEGVEWYVPAPETLYEDEED
ncbi:MAG: hypothetical protein Q4D96_08700 [Propionibacteriaceae bacterium]|nr:hypothetical protein [Propionibacteriaceae bacterium]